MRLLVCFFLVLISLPTYAQDFGWWNTTHNWDGYSPWRSYLTLAPGGMGPNALPVPDVQNGRLLTTPTLRLAGEAHFGDGDATQNAFLDLHLPLFSDRVTLRASYVPLEHYRMTPATRDARAARDFDARGWASGDLYLATHIQLLRDHARLPDVLLTINLRTASGNRLTAARFTDTPGYFFDVSVGKTFATGSVVDSLRPHALAGFYVWQTHAADHYQNDAVLYGLGLDMLIGSLTLTPALGGYTGYLGDGDRPLVARLSLQTTAARRVNFLARFQYGIYDFPFTSVRIGTSIKL